MANTLYYGDNLYYLREFQDGIADLIYLDPPFNSQTSYNLLFRTPHGDAVQAQTTAFKDTWWWDTPAERAFDDVIASGSPAAPILTALRKFLRESDMMAYLSMMAVRLIEMRRLLKPSGSLFLHCDPTASHYLKVMLDGIFGGTNLRNEIIWQRSVPKGLAFTRFASSHDVLLFYAKGSKPKWHAQYTPHREEYVAKYYGLAEEETGRRYQATSLINPNPDRPNLTYEFHGVHESYRRVLVTA
jgi:site-specific DNA-methyltransferase (adenine-specific)